MRIRYAAMTAVAAFLSLLGSYAIGAEAPNAKDMDTVNSCLKSKEANERAVCAGVVANPCVGDEAAAVPSQIIDCYAREQLVWDKMLNDAYAALRAALDDGQRIKLRDMQRSWLETRKLTCAFYYDYFEGSMANPMMANCEDRETARQAVFLLGFAEDVAGRVDDTQH